MRPWVLFALLVLSSSTAQAEMRAGSFHSESLGRDVGIAVQLPPSYDQAKERRFPVVYALHGLFENQQFWERRGLSTILDSLWAARKIPEFLLVAVDGGNSFFVNGPAGRYEDLITRDAVGYVESTYRVAPGRDRRALLGISMGGYAALRIAFAHPEGFGAVSTHSAMLLETIPTASLGARGWHMEAFHKVFGDPIDPVLWTASDPLALAEKADPKTTPALQFDCGTEDRYGLYTGNEDLHRRLEARRIVHEFALLPGDHGYEFVRAVLEGSLRFLGKTLEPASRPRAARR